jgi:sporulation related protein
VTPEGRGSKKMADDSIRSQHTNGSYGRESAPGGPNDPLAELARLIGQNDPFADFGRDTIRVGHSDDGAAGQRVEPRFESLDSDTYQAGADEHAHDEQGYAAYEGDESAMQREEIYDDPPRAHRRGGLITVMAVAGLAVLGTAGAFGYRAISGPSGPTVPPPVIRADTAPSKIVPAVGEQQSNKLIQDRVGSSQGERVVSREEQPVELRDARPARSVFPPVSSPNSTASASPWPAAPTAAPPPMPVSAAANEPKKVRTVAIRPDQPDASARPAAGPVRPPSAAPNAADSALPTPARPTVAGRPAGAGTGPMSLSPQTSASAAPTAPAPAEAPATQRPQRTALAPNPPAQPAATAASTGAGAGGSYVQVSSQRNETDAQASFKALQGKYPAVLGGKPVVIRRAELGDKGVYYRAMVGPFTSIEQATELCGSLKAAGGQCIVQRN